MDQHMIEVPESFRKNVLGEWGEEGEAWLNELPTIVEACLRQWHLELTPSSFEMSFGFVTEVRRKDGSAAILKIVFPDGEPEEINALAAFSGHRSVKLLEADRERHAMLLERIHPGTRLLDVQAHDDEEATKIGAELISDLSVPVPTYGSFTPLRKWKDEMTEIRQGGTAIPAKLIEQAEEIFEELDASKKEIRLIHGDLHHENILLDEHRGWIAIDPQGVIADPAYGAARFLSNPRLFHLQRNTEAVMQKRIEILSQALGQSRQRIIQWAFFDAVLCACWHSESGNPNWSRKIALAELLSSLMDTNS
jgi:streptomycin 6-kinase